MIINTTEKIIEKTEDVYRDDDKYAEFIKKKWVAVDDLIKKVEWIKLEQDKLMNILCIWRLDKNIDAEKFADIAMRIINLLHKAFEDVVKKG